MPYVPPAQPSIRVIFTSPYKGGTRTWSQRYFFTGGNFTAPQFAALVAVLEATLKTLVTSVTHITEYIGYDIGSDVPVRTSTVSVAGTYSPSTNPQMPLEVCALVKLTTTQRSTKNHPIYGFKYFHDVQSDGVSDREKLRTGYKGNLQSDMDAFIAGMSDGSSTRHWCDAKGAVFQAAIVSAELTHRDFPD